MTQSARISGSTTLGRVEAVIGGRCRSASIKPDSLMASRIDALTTKYAIQRPSAENNIDIAIMKMVARAISVSMSWMFIDSPVSVPHGNASMQGGHA